MWVLKYAVNSQKKVEQLLKSVIKCMEISTCFGQHYTKKYTKKYLKINSY